jgi:hypothetical protein
MSESEAIRASDWVGPWPSIGFEVCDYIEQTLVHGPGPMQGERPKLTEEEVRFILRAYEVHPRALCGNPRCTCSARVGLFRFTWADYVRLKGARKSELAAWLAHVELHGPARFAGWDASGEPVAAPLRALHGVSDIPFAATSEDQAEDTAWSTFYYVAQHCDYSHNLDINQRKVWDNVGSGNARVVTSSSIARDGGRPTCTVVEEPHLWHSRELRDLFKTLDRNLAKLGANDPHGFKVSTMFKAGENSVLEDDYNASLADDESLLWDHRGATSKLSAKRDEDIRRGVREAIGDAYWLDEERIVRQFKRDPIEGIRYWWNRRSVDVTRALDPDDWLCLAEPRDVSDGEALVLGFDGSMFDDCTALSARCLSDGYSFPLGVWQPSGADDGVSELFALVDETLRQACERWRVVLMFADPPYWHDELGKWRAKYGDKVIVPWWTNRDTQMAWATHRWHSSIMAKAWRHDGNPTVATHVANAHRRNVRVTIEETVAWVPRKERPKSSAKIDACVTDILSHEARYIAISQGALERLNRTSDRTLYSF